MSPSASKSTLGSLKRNVCDSSRPSSHSTTISAGFHNQISWGLLFIALETWAGEPGLGPGPFTLQGRNSAAKLPSQFSTATFAYRTGPFHTFTPPTSLDVAFSYS